MATPQDLYSGDAVNAEKLEGKHYGHKAKDLNTRKSLYTMPKCLKCLITAEGSRSEEAFFRLLERF
jgi:hypothetical protein